MWAIPYTYACMGCPYMHVQAIFLGQNVYGEPVHVQAAHTSIVGIPCFAHMYASAQTFYLSLE